MWVEYSIQSRVVLRMMIVTGAATLLPIETNFNLSTISTNTLPNERKLYEAPWQDTKTKYSIIVLMTSLSILCFRENRSYSQKRDWN
jgi:hypothetical protein